MKTEEEKVALINEFKIRTKDVKLSHPSFDYYLIKYLEMKNYAIDQAEPSLRKNLEWRRSNNADDILETSQPFEVFAKYISYELAGKDKFGCPLWFCGAGGIDFKGFLLSAPKKDISRLAIWIFERMIRQIILVNNTNKPGEPRITNQTSIIDMEGMDKTLITNKKGAKCDTLDIALDQFKIMENYYPCLHRSVFIINAPMFFSTLFKLIKPVFHKDTMEGIKIFGQDKSEWIPALLKEIDANQLPSAYGGNMIDPDGDPKCPSKFPMPGKIPKDLYLSSNKPIPREGMTTLQLPGGSKKQIKLGVNTENSVFRWAFMTENGGVRFSIHCKTSKDSLEMIPASKVESHLIMEEGQLICDLIGTYVIEFDNSSKIFKAKKIHYFVSVDSPTATDKN